MSGWVQYLVAFGLSAALAVAATMYFGYYADRMFDYPDEVDECVNRLLVMLYAMTTLGFVSITSPLGVPGGGVIQTLVTKLGFELLVLSAVGWFAFQALRDQASISSGAAGETPEAEPAAT